MLDYLEKRYFTDERKGRWMKAYRVGKYYAGMDTNNYVESWHNHLKSQFLRGHTNCRADRLIYVLTKDVDEFYQMIAMQNVVRRGRHTKGEINDFRQLAFLENKSKEELQSFVVNVAGDPSVYVVRSFSISGGYYFVSVDAESRVIKGCNYQYFIYSHRPCRHMLVLHQVYLNNGNSPFSLVHNIVEKVYNKHAIVECATSTLPSISIDDNIEALGSLPEEDDIDDQINEATEALRKFMHNSDNLVRSPEVAERYRILVDAICSLPTTESSSGVRKRQRQQY